MPFLQPCWLSLGKAGAPEGLQGSGSGLTQRAKRRSNATLVPVICTESKPQEQPFMGDKGNMGSSVNIQEQSKSPRSRACSRYPFHLFRAHWPPTAHVQCHLSCTKKSFQIQEMRCSSLPTKLPSCSPTGLFKISLPGTQTLRRQSHVLSALGQRRKSTLASFWSWHCQPLHSSAS